MSASKLLIYLLLCAALLLGGVFIYALGQFSPQQLGMPPWQIDVYADGSSQVLGVRLGHATLHELEQQMSAHAELSLFVSDQQQYELEAFWSKIRSGGLSAQLVANVQLSESEAEGYYQRGARIRRVRSGGYRVTLSEADSQAVRELPIRAMTYLPKARVELEMLLQRFGPPVESRQDEAEQLHLLYPDLGLDLVFRVGHPPVLQYVPPADFAQLWQPLRALPLVDLATLF